MHVFDAFCNSHVDVHLTDKYTVLPNKTLNYICSSHWSFFKNFEHLHRHINIRYTGLDRNIKGIGISSRGRSHFKAFYLETPLMDFSRICNVSIKSY